MKIYKKIILVIFISIIFITISNFLGLYISYNIYIKKYIDEKNEQKTEITLDYINKIIEKQNIDDIENIFNDAEIELFEKLNKNNGKILLNSQENIDLVIRYLSKAGVNPKYIEEIVPKNYFIELMNSIKNNETPEHEFIQKIIKTIIIINIITISILLLFGLFFTIKTIRPINEITKEITKIDSLENYKNLNYKNKDEIGMLVEAINTLNNKLKIQTKIRDNLLADISHELKTPITAIQCYMEGIKDNVIKLDERNLNSIINEMQRLVKLVNKIMEFEKFTSEDLKLNMKMEDVRFITEDIIKQFKQKLKNNNQKIITSGNNEKILLDKDLYTQIVQNIISNFIKYAGNETTLKIDFQKNFITFSDNGIGIDSKLLPFIKEKFYQVKKEKTGNIEDRGIGIGFSIIDKIIKTMKWEMQINSEIGKGLEIKIITKSSH